MIRWESGGRRGKKDSVLLAAAALAVCAAGSISLAWLGLEGSKGRGYRIG